MYLDPGFGSMAIQLLIGGIAALGSGLFFFRQRIKKLFTAGGKKPAGKTEAEGSAPEGEPSA
jgi:LPXTG-motif cell wall-anchored protein